MSMPDLALDLRNLRYAMIAAERGSFRRAAAALGVQQSTVSRRVQLLEHRVGMVLFERDHSGVRLTPAGERFLNEAAAGVSHFDRAIQFVGSMRRGEHGQISIGIVASLASGFLQSVIRRFKERHGGVALRLYEGAAHEILSRLVAGRLDVAFVTGGPPVSGCNSCRVWNERVYVALPSTHVLAARDQITWDDIRKERFIISSQGPGPHIQDYLIKRLAGLSFRPELDTQEVGRENLMNLVGLGLGLTLTTSSTLGAVFPGVVFRPIAGDRDIVEWTAIWPVSNTNPTLKRFLAVVRSEAKQSGANQ